MIFKITFQDNDFTELLEIICEKYKSNILWSLYKPENFENLSIQEQNKIYDEEFKFDKWCNVNTLNINKLTSSEIKLLEERIKIRILKYLKIHFYNENYEYLEKNLKVKFMKSFKVKFENGESVYYFPFNNSKWLTQ